MALALALAFFGIGVAPAQELTLQTELSLRAQQIGSPNGETDTSLRIEPRYQLSWRGPLKGGTNIYADVNSSGGLIAEPGIFGTEQDIQLNLHSQSQPLTLNATLSRSSESFSLLQPDGSHETVSSKTNAVSINGILSYPRYPLITFQHQWADSSSGGGGGSVRNTTIGANHDLGPLRLSYDRFWTDGGFGQKFDSQQFGANFTTDLTPMAQLSAHVFGGTLKTDGAEGLDSSHQSAIVRLAALPTPFLVLDGEVSYSRSDQKRLGVSLDSTALSHRVTLRSDPLPGVRLDLSERGQTGKSGGFEFDSQQYTADVGVTIGPGTRLLGLWSTARFNSFGIEFSSRQTEQQISFITPLYLGMDFHGSYSRSSRSRGDEGFDNSSLSLGVIGDIGANVVGRLTYRDDRQRDWSLTRDERIAIRSWQAHANWSPNPNWDLTLGLDYSTTTGVQRRRTISPIIETRWNPTDDTVLTLRYHLQRTSEFDRIIGDPFFPFNGRSSFLSARLTHILNDTDSFELGYDAQEFTGGLDRFRRVLEFRWLKRF